ncbi:MAG: carbohydrate binding domain-containing protein [Limisphaerales bacterium]
MRMILLLSALLAVPAASLASESPAAETEMLSNGEMEAPFANGLAQGWVPNCYGSNEVVFAQESTDVHGGKSAQRVTCTHFDSGGVQFHSGDIAVEKGKPYTLRLWMKGDVKAPVYVGLRKHGEPYTPYLKRDVRVRSDWTPYLIIGQPSDSDPRCGLYLMFAGTGTLLVDDVSLKPGIHEDAILEADGPAQKGNRIYNSGFEAGPEGWTPVNGFALDDREVHSGRFSARLEVTQVQGAPAGIECRPFPVRPGRRYTLSAWIKAAEPDTRVRLRLFEWADRGGDFPENRHEREATIRATTQWARYQLSGIVLPNLHEGHVARIVPSSKIWLDDVQVEEGRQTDYQPAQALEAGAETTTRWCRVGEAVEVTARVAATSQPGTLALRYTLEDLWSRPLTNLVHHIRLGESDRAQFLVRQPGMYRVRVRANESPATGEVWFGVFPQRDRRLRPDSPFGTHVTSVVPQPTPTMLASAAMGARWVRLHDFGDFCHWWVVEPEKGRFVWHDAEIAELRSRGFLVFANLGHPPRWAGRDHENNQGGGSWTPAPPRDNAEWEKYVFRTVEHYHDYIQDWEVWNEPYWKGFFTGTPEEYAQLLKVACRAIKRADPKAVVVGGCFTPTDEAWTQRVLAAGSLEFMDALSYHIYWSPPLTESTPAGAVPVVARQVQRFVELMRQHGPVKPIYMTEGGIRCPPFASWLPPEGFERSAPFGPDTGAGVPLTRLDAAAGLVRGMVEMLSAGVEKIFYYYSGHGSGAMPWFSTMANGYYVLLDYDGRPKPTMMAYSALESFLADAKPAAVLRHDDLSAHLFDRANGAVAVVWSTRTRLLQVPPDVSVLDLMGNEMKSPTLNAGEPVYVTAPKLKPAQLQALLR